MKNISEDIINLIMDSFDNYNINYILLKSKEDNFEIKDSELEDAVDRVHSEIFVQKENKNDETETEVLRNSVFTNPSNFFDTDINSAVDRFLRSDFNNSNLEKISENDVSGLLLIFNQWLKQNSPGIEPIEVSLETSGLEGPVLPRVNLLEFYENRNELLYDFSTPSIDFEETPTVTYANHME